MMAQRICQAGVSLIEALVALAVMAFGMVGVVGMQATLRYNGDVAKQRSEAVRLAQETIENRRAFSVYPDTAGHVHSYADIVDQAEITIAGKNADYKLTESVFGIGAGQGRTLAVAVSWLDRTGQLQSVQLSTAIGKVLPELGGGLGIPAFGSPTRLPGGRHSAIPRTAVDKGDGTSKFSPPGAGTTSWLFDNTSGFITKTCVVETCTNFKARLLAGFVAFATGATQPTPAMAEVPPGPSQTVEVVVDQTAPAAFVGTVACFEEALPLWVAYYCAMPVDVAPGDKWSGRSTVDIAPLATSIADASASKYRVCRYTTTRDHSAIDSVLHPLQYTDVKDSLIQQNFLVIKAGDGTTAFDCPADDAATPFVSGNTWHHQPST